MGCPQKILKHLQATRGVAGYRFIWRASNAVALPPELDDALESAEVKHRRHPGIRSHKKVCLPQKLQEAVKAVLETRDVRQLREGASVLRPQLWSRHLPVEDSEIRQKAASLERELLGDRLQTMSTEERDHLGDRVTQIVLEKLRTQTYRWKAFNYDEFGSYVYLVGRLAADYAVLHTIFSEVKHMAPTFAPKTVLDFGSGVGSVFWAIQDVWHRKLGEYFSVDPSMHMNSLARLLVQGGDPKADVGFRGYFQRQFLPASDKLKFDLVVSAFSLMELPSTERRIEMVASLWAKTSGILVLVENGTLAGHSAVTEARNFILTTSNLSTQDTKHVDDAHVIAPCPHDLECPKDLEPKRFPCTFAAAFDDSIFNPKVPSGSAMYSYTAIWKSPSIPEARTWPRIISPVLCRDRHAVCRLCCNDGKLREFVLTKKRHGRHVYRVARNSAWGDQLPVNIAPQDDGERTSS